MSSTPEIVPATDFVAVTKSDTVNLPQKARALYVGGAGDVACINAKGVSVVFAGILANTVLPVQTTRVQSTGTTATAIVALF